MARAAPSESMHMHLRPRKTITPQPELLQHPHREERRAKQATPPKTRARKRMRTDLIDNEDIGENIVVKQRRTHHLDDTTQPPPPDSAASHATGLASLRTLLTPASPRTSAHTRPVPCLEDLECPFCLEERGSSAAKEVQCSTCKAWQHEACLEAWAEKRRGEQQPVTCVACPAVWTRAGETIYVD
ncbi:hypothetical protein AC578_3646 [Pseudocercospora eumusae]|uniref:RING-type domain-containing protein n=1 Tax=Pseudocercospora eumusae TaxID=321146 RepID=A0A139GV32_9PEZI|nr:hypothetical protein AC578_3646 [Pseudocercospora eumusae]